MMLRAIIIMVLNNIIPLTMAVCLLGFFGNCDHASKKKPKTTERSAKANLSAQDQAIIANIVPPIMLDTVNSRLGGHAILKSSGSFRSFSVPESWTTDQYGNLVAPPNFKTEEGYSLVKFGSSIPTKACDEHAYLVTLLNTSHRYIGDSPNDDYRCSEFSGWFAHVKDPTGAVQSCATSLDCGTAQCTDEGICRDLQSECFHREVGCYVNKMKTMPKPNCDTIDWDHFKPKACSIDEKGEGCDAVGQLRSVAYVIDNGGELRYLQSLNIENAVTVDIDESFVQDFHWKAPGPVWGNSEYCRHNAQIPDCLHHDSGTGPFRIFRHNTQVPFLKLGKCSIPVYCYGFEDRLVYDYQQTNEVKECAGCSATCSESGYHIIMPIKGKTITHICGRSGCDTYDQNSDVIDAKRSFHSKVFDDRLSVDCISEDRLTVYKTFMDCPLVEICTALDCWFCSDHWLNPSCYKFYDWIVVLLVAYFFVLILSSSSIIILPILWSLISLSKIVLKLIYKLLKACCGKLKTKTERVVKYANTDDAEAQTRKPIVRATNPNRSPAVRYTPIGTGAFICTLLLTGAWGKQPCSNVIVTNIDVESCQIIGSQYECKPNSLVEVPIVSYDMAVCLAYLSPNGHIIGELQITPMDVSFKCQKRDLYWTRDYEMKYDHVTRCPHAGQCSEDWCMAVKTGTDVEGLSDLSYPHVQFCKLGSACAGHGCFFCTNSCHTIRYYAYPLTNVNYQLYNCPRWDPSSVVHFLWETSGVEEETVNSLTHGQSIEIFQGITVTLDLEIQTKLPVLSKTFITDGHRTAMVDASHAGQPVTGEVGQIQCETPMKAKKSDCNMAPNVCVCNPDGDDDTCDCSQIYISKVFDHENTLPASIGDARIELNRDVPYLKSPAIGSGKIMIRSGKTLRGPAVAPQKCLVDPKGLTGCYSCLSGANISYTCMTDKPMTTMMRCSNDIYITLQCGASGIVSYSQFQYILPLVDLTCTVPCSKDSIKLTGSLKHVSLPAINGGSHISLGPTETKQGIGASISLFFRTLGWYSFFWVGGVIIFIVIMFVVVRKTFYQKFLQGKVKNT